MNETKPGKTIPEIRREYGSQAAGLMNAHHERIDEIASERRLPEGEYLDRLTDEQRNRILLERKTAAAGEDHRRVRQEYGDLHARYEEDLAARAEFLNRRLFSIEGAEGASLLSRAALAGEEELGVLLDVAAQAKNADLGQAVFVAAHRRGLGDLMHRFFTEIDPEAQALYNEHGQIPPAEVVERQRENIERMVPTPSAEKLAGAPRVNS